MKSGYTLSQLSAKKYSKMQVATLRCLLLIIMPVIVGAITARPITSHPSPKPSLPECPPDHIRAPNGRDCFQQTASGFPSLSLAICTLGPGALLALWVILASLKRVCVGRLSQHEATEDINRSAICEEKDLLEAQKVKLKQLKATVNEKLEWAAKRLVTTALLLAGTVFVLAPLSQYYQVNTYSSFGERFVELISGWRVRNILAPLFALDVICLLQALSWRNYQYWDDWKSCFPIFYTALAGFPCGSAVKIWAVLYFGMQQSASSQCLTTYRSRFQTVDLSYMLNSCATLSVLAHHALQSL